MACNSKHHAYTKSCKNCQTAFPKCTNCGTRKYMGHEHMHLNHMDKHDNFVRSKNAVCPDCKSTHDKMQSSGKCDFSDSCSWTHK